MPHHAMRRKEKEIADRAELEGILGRGKFATLALCRDGEPYAVTLNFGFDAERNALWFHCAQEGMKIEILRANPRVCGTVIEDRGYKKGKCSHAYRTAVFRGTAAIVADLEEKKRGLRALVERLEENPAPILDKVLKDEKALAEVCVLRLDLEETTGKQGT
jgi:nitroimidazol reductase NimA-like FMN-containing flavoprotein (pyridoxamine 5'-phosphate oxidase superfamily)